MQGAEIIKLFNFAQIIFLLKEFWSFHFSTEELNSKDQETETVAKVRIK